MTGGGKSIGRAIVDAFVGERAMVGFWSHLVKSRQGAPSSFVSGADFVVDGAITTRVQY